MSIGGRTLVALGVILFFLGLLSGFAIPAFTNVRMGVSSHLEGVMNGTFLVAIGLAWHMLVLSPMQERIAFWFLVYGSFANWLFVTLGAVFGTAALSPVAGAGFTGQPWQETIVSVGLMSVGLAMLIACGLMIPGYCRKV